MYILNYLFYFLFVHRYSFGSPSTCTVLGLPVGQCLKHPDFSSATDQFGLRNIENNIKLTPKRQVLEGAGR